MMPTSSQQGLSMVPQLLLCSCQSSLHVHAIVKPRGAYRPRPQAQATVTCRCKERLFDLHVLAGSRASFDYLGLRGDTCPLLRLSAGGWRSSEFRRWRRCRGVSPPWSALLHRPVGCEPPRAGQQLSMGAHVGDAATVHHYHPVAPPRHPAPMHLRLFRRAKFAYKERERPDRCSSQ